MFFKYWPSRCLYSSSTATSASFTHLNVTAVSRGRHFLFMFFIIWNVIISEQKQNVAIKQDQRDSTDNKLKKTILGHLIVFAHSYHTL